MPVGLIAKKLGHTRVYDANGVITPVTVVLAGPNRVLQVKTKEGKDGYSAVQLGFGAQKPQRLTKPKLGHLKKFGVEVKDKSTDALAGVQRILEFRDYTK